MTLLCCYYSDPAKLECHVKDPVATLRLNTEISIVFYHCTIPTLSQYTIESEVLRTDMSLYAMCSFNSNYKALYCAIPNTRLDGMNGDEE